MGSSGKFQLYPEVKRDRTSRWKSTCNGDFWPEEMERIRRVVFRWNQELTAMKPVYTLHAGYLTIVEREGEIRASRGQLR